MSTAELIIKELSKLDAREQEGVLRYVQSMSSRPRGVAFSELRAAVPTMSAEDAEEMQRAIDENCEHIDEHGW